MSETKEESNSTSSDLKEEDDASAKTEEAKTDESSKDSDKDSKDSVKNDTKKDTKKEAKKPAESAKDDSEKEESEDESEDEGMGLLDRPVEVSGCRARKKVERLEISFTPKERSQAIVDGAGKKLGECPRIENQIQKTSNIDLKPLHKVLFGRVGGATEVKRNIRKFSGFTFARNSAEFNKKKAQLGKLTGPVLKHMCAVLDIERGGTKADIVTRVLDFLMLPKDSGLKVPTKKKSSTKKSAPKAKKSKAKKGKEASSDDNSEMDVDVENESASDKNSEKDEKEDDEDEKGSEDDSDLEPPKKKSKPAKTTKKAPPKKAEKKEKTKKEGKKSPVKGSKRKRDEDSDEDSEEESAPASKKKGPSDEDIKKLVSTILKDANLEEITMKKVIKQVAAAFPAVDLSSRKSFIKATIKSCIS